MATGLQLSQDRMQGEHFHQCDGQMQQPPVYFWTPVILTSAGGPLEGLGVKAEQPQLRSPGAKPN